MVEGPWRLNGAPDDTKVFADILEILLDNNGVANRVLCCFVDKWVPVN
jgi:hypothetical protein